MDETVKPLSPTQVKEIRLDTTHKIIEIAPGVKFSAWTFGDTWITAARRWCSSISREQTVLLGSSNAAIVEFMIPEAGGYRNAEARAM